MGDCDQKYPNKQMSGQDDVRGEPYPSKVKTRANAYLSQTFPKITEEGTLPNSFYKATITFI